MMKVSLILIALLLPVRGIGQQDSQDSIVLGDSVSLDLSFLVAEAVMRNPEIQAALSEWDALEARVPQEGSLPYPELRFMQEEMPGFSFNEAMYSRWELMQTIPFPSKLGARRGIAAAAAEHAHHDHLEKVNDLIARLKKSYYELWFVQQSEILEREQARLLSQFESIARTRYATGSVTLGDVLKSEIELAMVSNEQTGLRQGELSTKAMLMAMLNRGERDTLGYAVIPEEFSFGANLDSLIALAMQSRPMVLHESLKVDEGNARVGLANKEYLPDFTVGLERVTSPSTGFSGWSVRAGITLPFAPWTLGRVNAGVDEATASASAARSSYEAVRLMVAGNIRDFYYKADSYKRQLDLYRQAVLPSVRQSLTLSLTSYQSGRTEFLALIDAYRAYVNATREYFMLRMNFEQTTAELEREVGSTIPPTSR